MSNESLKEKSYEVKPSSLPYCLRHLNRHDAIIDARDITVFIQEALDLEIINDDNGIGENTSGNGRRGLSLCLNLLIDKLNIASGEYIFPLVGNYTDKELCKRIAPADVEATF